MFDLKFTCNAIFPRKSVIQTWTRSAWCFRKTMNEKCVNKGRPILKLNIWNDIGLIILSLHFCLIASFTYHMTWMAPHIEIYWNLYFLHTLGIICHLTWLKKIDLENNGCDMQNFFLLEFHVCALYFWAHVHSEGEFREKTTYLQEAFQF